MRESQEENKLPREKSKSCSFRCSSKGDLAAIALHPIAQIRTSNGSYIFLKLLQRGTWREKEKTTVVTEDQLVDLMVWIYQG